MLIFVLVGILSEVWGRVVSPAIYLVAALILSGTTMATATGVLSMTSWRETSTPLPPLSTPATAVMETGTATTETDVLLLLTWILT